jgi:hypothetical protein
VVDTTPEVQAILNDRLRALSIADKARMVDELTTAVTQLSIAGIQRDHPNATDDDVRYHLALRRYSKELADEVYGTRE